MRSNSFLLFFLIFFTTLGLGCTSQAEPLANRAFEFSSGGAYHPEGFGEWKIKLDGFGTFSIAHNVRGELKEYGTFLLSEKENSEFWKLILATNIDKLESLKRAGIPDEVKYAFVLRNEMQVHSIEIWVNDARKNNKIVALVDRIATLIEKYTKEKPVLK